MYFALVWFVENSILCEPSDLFKYLCIWRDPFWNASIWINWLIQCIFWSWPSYIYFWVTLHWYPPKKNKKISFSDHTNPKGRKYGSKHTKRRLAKRPNRPRPSTYQDWLTNNHAKWASHPQIKVRYSRHYTE